MYSGFTELHSWVTSQKAEGFAPQLCGSHSCWGGHAEAGAGLSAGYKLAPGLGTWKGIGLRSHGALEPKPVPPHLAVGFQDGPAVWEVLEKSLSLWGEGQCLATSPAVPRGSEAKGTSLRWPPSPIYLERRRLSVVMEEERGKDAPPGEAGLVWPAGNTTSALQRSVDELLLCKGWALTALFR